ncbi:hypothetical protein NBH08_30270 [Faecalicatena sp. BF-R-105]|nr:hypothetical protein [Faecalicatena sp. BF-R-105]
MEFHFLPSDKHYGHFGIIGHVGVGHVHSHSGYVQDDSAGFAAAACLLRRAFPVDTTIVHAQADPNTGCITIITKDLLRKVKKKIEVKEQRKKGTPMQAAWHFKMKRRPANDMRQDLELL